MNSLAKKLNVKPNTKWLIFNAPNNYLTLLEPLPDGVTVAYTPGSVFDGTQLFVKDSAELSASLKVVIPALKYDAVFWVIYPKKSSGIKTDLAMMSSWDELGQYGYTSVAAAAVNETWTALRFRPQSESKASDSRNEEIKKNEYANYIDVDNKQITLPQEIKQRLEKSPTALAFYESLSYSNKKEYVLWILTAKQEKTREERLTKMLDKLLEGKKNPSEK